MKDQPYSTLWWLWLPLFWLGGQIAIEFLYSVEDVQRLHQEGSIHEWLQFVLLLGAFVLALSGFLKIEFKKQPWLKLWLALAAIGFLYVGGEEISWGQWVFNWSTPAEWAAINNQNETNLHNMSRWLNQIPRYILQVSILIGGLIIPLLMFIKPNFVPARFNMIYPPRCLWAIALVLVFITLGHKASKEFFDLKLFSRSSEVEEIFMYYFLFLYMVVLHRRVKSHEIK